MGSSLGLIHLGWYQLKANPLLNRTKEELVPEPGIVTYVSPSTAPPTAKSRWTNQVCRRKPRPFSRCLSVCPSITSLFFWSWLIDDFVLQWRRMKPQSWLRRNWLWAAGGAFVTIHLSTWLLQRSMKSVAHSEAALKRNAAERTDWRGVTIELLTCVPEPLTCVLAWRWPVSVLFFISFNDDSWINWFFFFSVEI